jgi:SET domain
MEHNGEGPSSLGSNADSKPNQALVPVADGCVFSIRKGPKGRGLFASSDIPPRTLIHVAPCIPILKDEYDQHMKHTVLEHYLFNDTRSSGAGNKLLALGYGSLFNHSSHPNVDYRVNSENLAIEYSSGYQTIPKDEELCISYGSNLWFEVAEGQDTSVDDDENDGVAAFLGRIELGDNNPR